LAELVPFDHTGVTTALQTRNIKVYPIFFLLLQMLSSTVKQIYITVTGVVGSFKKLSLCWMKKRRLMAELLPFDHTVLTTELTFFFSSTKSFFQMTRKSLGP
jgi:hypothetical protein